MAQLHPCGMSSAISCRAPKPIIPASVNGRRGLTPSCRIPIPSCLAARIAQRPTGPEHGAVDDAKGRDHHGLRDR
jgi:hypothetical protein